MKNPYKGQPFPILEFCMDWGWFIAVGLAISGIVITITYNETEQVWYGVAIIISSVLFWIWSRSLLLA